MVPTSWLHGPYSPDVTQLTQLRCAQATTANTPYHAHGWESRQTSRAAAEVCRLYAGPCGKSKRSLRGPTAGPSHFMWPEWLTRGPRKAAVAEFLPGIRCSVSDAWRWWNHIFYCSYGTVKVFCWWNAFALVSHPPFLPSDSLFLQCPEFSELLSWQVFPSAANHSENISNEILQTSVEFDDVHVEWFSIARMPHWKHECTLLTELLLDECYENVSRASRVISLEGL